MAEAKLKTLGTELSETLGRVRPRSGASVGHAVYHAGGPGAAMAEAWGKHTRKESGAGVEAWVLSIDAGFNSKIIVALDTFSTSRTDLCAAFAAYKQRSEFTFIEPAFFINFRNAPPRG